jgi:glycosyltransferase involved in cell wall biosynthesis
VKISLCLIVWNEFEGCELDVPNIPREPFDEVFAVDGGSTDGTVAYLESHGIPVYRQPKKGLNAAYVYAAERSTCDAVVVFFPKGTTPTTDLLRFRPLLEAGHDLVIASRNIKGGKNEEDEQFLKPRKWSGFALACLAAVVWRREGYFVRDILHGFKGFTVAAFNQMAPLDYGLSIDLEMAVRAYRLRLKRTEFPTTELSRSYGKTHFQFLPTGINLAKYLWHELNRGD